MKIVHRQRKWQSKNGDGKFFFLSPFWNFFFLFLLLNYDKKEKSKNIFFYSINGGETPIGYTFRVSYSYRADCIMVGENVIRDRGGEKWLGGGGEGPCTVVLSSHIKKTKCLHFQRLVSETSHRLVLQYTILQGQTMTE